MKLTDIIDIESYEKQFGRQYEKKYKDQQIKYMKKTCVELVETSETIIDFGMFY